MSVRIIVPDMNATPSTTAVDVSTKRTKWARTFRRDRCRTTNRMIRLSLRATFRASPASLFRDPSRDVRLESSGHAGDPPKARCFI